MTPAKYAAPMHQVDVTWRLTNTRDVVIGPEPRLVLAARALRDCEVLLFRLDYPGLLHGADVRVEAVLCEVPRVWGQRRLKAEGDSRIAAGTEDVNARAMLAAPEALAPQEVRWDGGLVRVLQHNVCGPPHNYWAWAGRVHVPKGFTVGLICRADGLTLARARLCGV